MSHPILAGLLFTGILMTPEVTKSAMKYNLLPLFPIRPYPGIPDERKVAASRKTSTCMNLNLNRLNQTHTVQSISSRSKPRLLIINSPQPLPNPHTLIPQRIPPNLHTPISLKHAHPLPTRLPSKITLPLHKPSQWPNQRVMRTLLLLLRQNIPVPPEPQRIITRMRNPPLNRNAVHTLRPELNSISMDQPRRIHTGRVRCQRVDQASLHVVHLHVGVDSAPGVGVPVLYTRWEFPVWVVEWD